MEFGVVAAILSMRLGAKGEETSSHISLGSILPVSLNSLISSHKVWIIDPTSKPLAGVMACSFEVVCLFEVSIYREMCLQGLPTSGAKALPQVWGIHMLFQISGFSIRLVPTPWVCGLPSISTISLVISTMSHL